ncbi:ribonuclease HII [Nocardioides sp. Y6]|uniref:Ribonuclease HII n=1 Tax=Nocardioides malaquae TaxID=2773426 RepID=A0ABR9RPN8_9ACTN|nr:ribonuclease HII [Nocardioides malaquae]MBE7323360.1 ribonuclease HII [Nocardioides malaquae]
MARTTPTGHRPTLRLERSLLRGGVRQLACADEVGRGALCGPVSIGMVVITEQTRTAPQGVRDSKLLTPAAREALAPRVRRWATAYAVGHASAEEIDEHGIMVALRLAGHRALAGLGTRPDLVLLDGNHDYLSVPEQMGLFGGPPGLLDDVPPVVTCVKGDMRCAGVAAASILAKTERDAMMLELAREHPHYGWVDNKGYSAPEHVAALRERGPSPVHRRSWSLPGVSAPSALGSLVSGSAKEGR